MRICLVTSVHQPFDQRIFFKEARSLAHAGHSVTLLAPAELSREVREGVEVLGLVRPRSRWGRPRLWFDLLIRVLRIEPDLVHMHDPELLILAPILRLLRGRRLRIVYDVHEYFVDSIAHKVWIPVRLRPLVARFAAWGERVLGKTVDGLVLVVEEQLPFYSGWQAEKSVVHNYPDAATFAGATPLPAFPPDRFRLMYLGSLYARRGILTMLEALTQVVPQAPETLLIVGGAFESNEFRAQVESFISEHALMSHIVVLGWIDHSQVKDYLVSADVAWLPGLQVQQYQRRGISTKLLESMLMGLPLVTSDHPHRRSFVDEAGCGFAVSADDPSAHAEAILWLYRHPEERQAMGERGRQLVLGKYTWEVEAATLLTLYDRLLSRGTTLLSHPPQYEGTNEPL